MIRLLINFEVGSEQAKSFEEFCRETYIVALSGQPGYVGSSLSRSYAPDVLREIGADEPGYNYQLTLEFESEAARRAWVSCPEHDPIWTRATGMSIRYSYTGYNVLTQHGKA